MSEPVSAFQAYKTNGAKYGVGTKKKTAGGKKGKPSPKKNNKSKKSNSPKTGKKSSTNANNSKAIIKPKEAKKSAKIRATSSDSSLTSNGFIQPAEVDQLVEELYDDSHPANPRKLSKAQQKKKKQLEAYLVRQLEKEEDKEDDEISYTDEFTLNSHSDDDDETGMGTFSYTDADSDNEEGEEFNLQALEKAKSSAAQKRKSNEGTTETDTKKNKKLSENGSNATEAKKTKKSEESKPAAVTARKSMPTTKSEKQIQIKNKHRSVGDMSSVPPVSHSTPQSAAVSAPLKLEPLSPPSNIAQMNSIDEGLKAFRWLLNPVTVDDFFAKYWEKNACLVQRRQSKYFSHLISFEAIDQMLLKNHVEFTKNIDVTSYKNGVRETLNPEGRAMPPAVWDHYGQGCSIRLLNPQTFLPALFSLNTTMQEYFHCLVGANAYLTPPNSQGFAPHYDDIEAFVLQIEGRKRWKLYKPRSQAEMLPRVSSKNFTQAEIGKPILDQVLEPGDVLYFPRGTIHQASTEPGYHSLHITLSVYQKQSYADLFEKMMPIILQKAIANNVDMRRGLPLHTWHHAGIAFSENDTKERAELLQKVAQLLGKCLHSNSLAEVMDSAVDQVALKFQHEALPPQILPPERLRTVFGSRSRTNELGECVCDYDIDLRSNVRLLRANIVRLVNEEQSMRVYYYLDNSKEYCQYEPNFIEIETEEAGSVEVLIKSYPQYVGVSQLPLADDERKIQVVTALWERGLLMLEKPFQ